MSCAVRFYGPRVRGNSIRDRVSASNSVGRLRLTPCCSKRLENCPASSPLLVSTIPLKSSRLSTSLSSVTTCCPQKPFCFRASIDRQPCMNWLPSVDWARRRRWDMSTHSRLPVCSNANIGPAYLEVNNRLLVLRQRRSRLRLRRLSSASHLNRPNRRTLKPFSGG